MSKVIGQDTFTSAVPGTGKQSPDLGVIITVTAVGTTTSGNVSYTYQLEGSNDGTDWHAVGASVVVAAGASPQISNATRVQFAYAQYRVNLTAITGTGAQVVTTIAVGS